MQETTSWYAMRRPSVRPYKLMLWCDWVK